MAERSQRLFVNAASAGAAQAGSRQGEEDLRVPVPKFVPAQDATQQGSSGCPVVGPTTSSGSACPVVGESELNPLNNMPALANRQEGNQAHHLGTARQVSSIPLAERQTQETVHHQEAAKGSGHWVYPSEQMFFNAMKRKGWDPNAGDMHTVVQIHNAVNERAWQMILDWESNALTSCGEPPKLKRFIGRPRDISPKARLLNFLGYKLPFDRHDWYITRCGRDVRYVIDFYNAAAGPGMPVAMHLDVRPALDSPQAALERLAMQW
eukprot:CAMPEP_0117656886 /NCGR_PEP_ID=MMETSP0804-20121206/5040_1 /TAXON_ID=1074897 /ORGANISM="Tetraselmis astigmatica, Strain CCMP880" /LENGTH=264 /DNA_ID=CAMNT_0005463311 /DNA_START=6 /DNA_END=797 /DNA_ORIENTATION=-